jgi:hypothetical protein
VCRGREILRERKKMKKKEGDRREKREISDRSSSFNYFILLD